MVDIFLFIPTDMLRMRQLLKYLYKYAYRIGAGQQVRFDFTLNGIEQREFKLHLIFQKHFLESWRSTLILKARHYLGIKLVTQEMELNWAHQRSNRIDLLIEGCRKKGYLDSNARSSLKPTELGRQFSQGWGMVFFNECFKEYPVIAIIIGSISLVSLLNLVWNLTKPFITNILGLK